MMTLLSLSLFISSLVAAAFLSPPSDPNPQIREGHRIFVVEYERQLPPQSSSSPPVSGVPSVNFKDAASDFSRSSEEKISSLSTNTKGKEVQLEESSADAAKAVSEKAKAAGEEADANISTATRKAVDQAEATAAKLEKNLIDIMRRARDLGLDFMMQLVAGARTAARSSAAVAHLLGFAIAFGTCVWVTFVSSHVLASGLPRQQFGIVQSRIYPLYFGAVGVSVGTAVVAFFIGSGWRTAAEKAQGCNMLGVLGMTMVNMLYLEPRATKAMFERIKLEKEDGRRRDIVADDEGAEPVVNGPPSTPAGSGPTTKVPETTGQETVKGRLLRASKTLRRLNTYSSFLNVSNGTQLAPRLLGSALGLELLTFALPLLGFLCLMRFILNYHNS